MRKRIFIIHRWLGTPNSDWYPWAKEELEKKGFEVARRKFAPLGLPEDPKVQILS